MLTAEPRTAGTGPPGPNGALQPEMTHPHAALGDAATIEARGLRKSYGKGVNALEALDLSVPRAAIGLLGANGAGKTTLIKVAAWPGQAQLRLGERARARHREPGGRAPPLRRLHAGVRLPAGRATAADFVGHMAEMSGLPRPGRPPARRRCPLPGRTGRRALPADQGLLDRHEAAGQARPGDRPRPRPRLPRRADKRPRPQGRDDMLDLIDAHPPDAGHHRRRLLAHPG